MNGSGTPIDPELFFATDELVDPEPIAVQPFRCQICQDRGIYKIQADVGDPDFNKVVHCRCQQGQREQQRAERTRQMSALGQFADKTFATFGLRENLSSPQQDALRSAAQIAYAYAEDPQGWLLLSGSYGSGKTHLAAAIANFRLDNFAERPVLVTVPDLLEHLRQTFGPSSEVAYDEVFDQVREADLLVLDDLGAESSTAWAQEKLYVLLNHRHVRRLPTVITTNQDIEAMDGRIKSRLLDVSLTRSVPLNVPDHRSPSSGYEHTLYDMSRYTLMTFDRFEDRSGDLSEAEQDTLDRLVQTCKEFAQHPRGWLVLIGAPSVGKTHLAAAIAHERTRQGDDVVMTSHSELIDNLRAAFGGQKSMMLNKRIAELRGAGLLVLDNLTIDESTPPWVRERLHDVLIYRFDQGLPTILTLYQGATEDPRIASRIENKARSTVPKMNIPPYKGTTHHATRPRRTRTS